MAEVCVCVCGGECVCVCITGKYVYPFVYFLVHFILKSEKREKLNIYSLKSLQTIYLWVQYTVYIEPQKVRIY